MAAAANGSKQDKDTLLNPPIRQEGAALMAAKLLAASSAMAHQPKEVSIESNNNNTVPLAQFLLHKFQQAAQKMNAINGSSPAHGPNQNNNNNKSNNDEEINRDAEKTAGIE